MPRERFSMFCVLCVLAASSLRAEDPISFSVNAGTDGLTSSMTILSSKRNFGIGVDLGLGFEYSDLVPNDPTLALRASRRFFAGGRWEGWGSFEIGCAIINTGYDTFGIPFLGLSSRWRFALSHRLGLVAETGLRFGRIYRNADATLDLVEVHYRELVYAQPLVFRLGVEMSF